MKQIPPSLILVCLLLIPHWLDAQAPEIPQIIPPSPEAAAFGKYGDLPVSTYSGTPNISIPLYEVRNGDISIPIGLSYHSSGVKVDEEASWVGLGWVLNGGGVISRTIMGKSDLNNAHYFTSSVPDFEKTFSGTYYTYNTFTGDDMFNLDCDFEYLANLNITGNLLSPHSAIDFQPDQYSYNFGSYAGGFALKRDESTIFTNSYDKIKFEPTVDGNNSITSWTVTDPNGVVYTFGESELHHPADASAPTPTAWYLTQITSPTGKSITLSYINHTSLVRSVGSLQSTDATAICLDISATGPLGGCPTNPFVLATPSAPREYDVPVLSEIDFQYGVVKFLSTNTQRDDLPNGSRLNSIEVYSKDHKGVLESEPLKKWVFDYGYLETVSSAGTNDTDGGEQFYTNTDYLFKRMKLNKLIEASLDGSILLENCPAYRFSYITSAELPAKTSLARDHWGYFNGQYSNTVLHPRFIGVLSDFHSVYKDLAGADRDADSTFAKAFSLNKITYPTGGKTTLVYEGHTFDYDSSAVYDDYKDYVPDLELKQYTGSATPGTNSVVPFTIDNSSFPVAVNGTARVRFQATFICGTTPCPTTTSTQVSARIFDAATNLEISNTLLGLNSPGVTCINTSPCNEEQGEHILELAPGDYYVEAQTTHNDVDYVDVVLDFHAIPKIVQGGGLGCLN